MHPGASRELFRHMARSLAFRRAAEHAVYGESPTSDGAKVLSSVVCGFERPSARNEMPARGPHTQLRTLGGERLHSVLAPALTV